MIASFMGGALSEFSSSKHIAAASPIGGWPQLSPVAPTFPTFHKQRSRFVTVQNQISRMQNGSGRGIDRNARWTLQNNSNTRIESEFCQAFIQLNVSREQTLSVELRTILATPLTIRRFQQRCDVFGNGCGRGLRDFIF